MKSFLLLLLGVFLSGVLCAEEDSRAEVVESQSQQLLSLEEERRILRVLIDKYKDFIKTNDLTSDMTNIIATSLDSVDSLTQIDYNKPARQLIKEIGDALVPLISFGLSFIPGVGPILSGVFSQVWKLVGPLFGGKKSGGKEKKKLSPMEMMIEQAEQEMSLKMDATLREHISAAIHGDMNRNKYICNKYSLVSAEFADELKRRQPINETSGIKLTLYFENCDNFLKDTAEAFVYPHYADSLWIPSALSTVTRMAFLSEIVNYGHLLGLSGRMLFTYWQEVKNDTDRQFQFYNQGVRKRFDNILATAAAAAANTDKKHVAADNNNGDKMLTTPSTFETEACKLQGMLVYFDRELFPYGTPIKVTVTSPDNPQQTVLNMADYVNGTVDTNHVQVFYDYTSSSSSSSSSSSTSRSERFSFFNKNKNKDKKTSDASDADGDDDPLYVGVFNCFMGPVFASLPRSATLSVQLVLKKSYEIRVVYVSRKYDVTKESIGDSSDSNVDDTQTTTSSSANDDKKNKRIAYISQIDEGNPKTSSVVSVKFSSDAVVTSDTRTVFRTKAAAFYTDCKQKQKQKQKQQPSSSASASSSGPAGAAAVSANVCKWQGKYLYGRYHIDSVGTLNALPDETTPSSVRIEVDGETSSSTKIKNEMDVLLVGIELIIRPTIN